MDNCKLVHENVYDFKLKNGQIVNAVAFNSIFQKFVDNDESLMRVRDKYCYGPKTFHKVEDYYSCDEVSSTVIEGEETVIYWYYPENDKTKTRVWTTELSCCPLNPERIYYKTPGYKVWQNINYTESSDRVLPGSRTSDYDIYQLNEISDFISGYTGLDTEDEYYEYWDKITQTPGGLSSDAWTSTFEDSNVNNVATTANKYQLSSMNEHLRAFHGSYEYDKELNLNTHKPTINKQEGCAIVISADLPQTIRKITNSEYVGVTVKNPYTFTHFSGHDGDVSDSYKDIGIIPTTHIIEYASGIKYIYINIPSTKTYWLPFVAPTQVKYQDGYINFYNLPFDSQAYKSDTSERNYFGLGENDTILYGCDEYAHPRKRYVDVSDPAFVTDFKVTLKNLDISKVFNVVMSNESPALNRVQFGYTDEPLGLFQKQHGGDNSYYPPSIMVEDPVVDEENGTVTLHCCCFGSDSQNIMVICH